MKKKIKKRGKIVATLITVISFAAALTWYQMQNAYAYEHGTESKSTTLSKGYADVIIHGPNNKEEWINVEFFYSGKKMSQDKFNNSGHNITVKRKDGERSGVYSANVPTQTVTTSANGSGNYTRIKFNVEYWQPEHEEYSWESADSVSADYLSPKYQKASSDFQSQSWHGAEGRKVTVSVEMSIYAVGICTYNYKGKYHKVWNTAVHLGLQKPSRSVYYNTNGGTNHGDTWYFTDGDKFSFPSTERTGYTFDGWRKNNGSGDWVDTNDIVCGGNYTVAAQWTANTYSISYDADDGDGDMSETSATYNKTVTLSQNKFTRKGYKFLGWSLKNDGSSVDYQNGASFTYDKADDITLYAVWEKDNYEVKFHGNGSSATDYTRNLPYNKTTNLPENVFERPGYTFMGWAPEEELDRYKVIPKYTNGAEVKDLCEPGETCNLYAIWRKTDGSFETKNIIHDDKMFFGDVNITGGNGTEYDQGMYDSKAAKIDKENDPGYFTDRYKKED